MLVKEPPWEEDQYHGYWSHGSLCRQTTTSHGIFCLINIEVENEHDGHSNHRRLDCLLNRLFRRRSKKTSQLRVTGLCEGNSPVTGEFPAQRASNAEDVSIWWSHKKTGYCPPSIRNTSNFAILVLWNYIKSKYISVFPSEHKALSLPREDKVIV